MDWHPFSALPRGRLINRVLRMELRQDQDQVAADVGDLHRRSVVYHLRRCRCRWDGWDACTPARAPIWFTGPGASIKKGAALLLDLDDMWVKALWTISRRQERRARMTNGERLHILLRSFTLRHWCPALGRSSRSFFPALGALAFPTREIPHRPLLPIQALVVAVGRKARVNALTIFLTRSRSRCRRYCVHTFTFYTTYFLWATGTHSLTRVDRVCSRSNSLYLHHHHPFRSHRHPPATGILLLFFTSIATTPLPLLFRIHTYPIGPTPAKGIRQHTRFRFRRRCLGPPHLGLHAKEEAAPNFHEKLRSFFHAFRLCLHHQPGALRHLRTIVVWKSIPATPSLPVRPEDLPSPLATYL
ncbi:hypothetical protein R3P38DRAFT_3175734 [Favolaschia claudopus]|uniref:Uncharacterized protein n=1 Tax=Favolaschia claudopus TaxID=2862362 RepID=A0AAW0D6K9_9AGAR